MYQTLAEVLQNYEVMGPFTRSNILSSRVIWLKCSEIAREVRPGQFVMVRCGEETVLRRPLSIHQVEDDRLALLYAVIGKGTQWLAACQPGDKVDIFGPLGNGFTVYPDSRNLLLVAGGMGIAPLMFLAEREVAEGREVTLLYGTANKDRYQILSGVAVVAATEDGSVGYQGMVTDLIPQYLEKADQVFACGPLPMLKSIADITVLKGKPVQVSLEMRMGCGFGICYSCTIRTAEGLKQVCRDGPVFKLTNLIWEEIKI